jgi:hypothetical protein
MPIKQRDVDTGGPSDQTQVLFKAVSVFDRSQVQPLPDRQPARLEPPCEPLTGNSHAQLLDPLVAVAATFGFTVSFETIDAEAGGWCDARAKHVVVDATAPANARVRTLVHELAHALGLGYRDLGRERAEVLVDTVTFIVCSSVGLDVGGESIPYVAGWGERGDLDAIREYAQLIDATAHRIEDALADAAPQDELARAA